MYDAVTPSNVPVDAQMVAGYIDGNYQSFNGLVVRCPNAVHVPIAVHASTNNGVVLDVEQGDATPSQAPGWCQMRRQAGQLPTVYCSYSVWDQVQQAFRASGVPEPEYWIAAYPGIGPSLYPGAVAHQYADPGPYDLSVVADFWPGVDASPVEDDLPYSQEALELIFVDALNKALTTNTVTQQTLETIVWSALETDQAQAAIKKAVAP